MRRFFLCLCASLAFVVGLLGSGGLVARDPAFEDAFDYHLKGNDGFRYRILETSESVRFFDKDGKGKLRYPLLSPKDGTPLYEGWSFDENGQVIRIRASWQELIEGSRLEGMTPAHWSAGRSRMEIFLTAPLILQSLNDLNEPQKAWLKNNPALKASEARLIQQALFGEEIELSLRDLESFRRKMSQPETLPIEFPDEKSLFGLSFILKNRLSIQIEDIKLGIAARELLFEPQEDQLKVRLTLNQVQFSGLARNRVEPLPVFGDFDFDWQSLDLKLESAEIRMLERSVIKGWTARPEQNVSHLLDEYSPENSDDGLVQITFDLQLKRTLDNVWSLELLPGTFSFDFLEPESDETARSSASERVPALSFRAVADLPGGERRVIQQVREIEGNEKVKIRREMTEMLTQAITQRFFAKSFEWAVPFLKRPSSQTAFQLAGWDVRADGVALLFDLHSSSQDNATCVEGFSPSGLSLESLAELEIEAQTEGQDWSLSWMSKSPDSAVSMDSVWSLQVADVDKISSQASVRLGVDVLNFLLAQSWREGYFCWDSRSWRHRPADFPLIRMAPPEPPSFEVANDILRLHWPWRFQSFQRNQAVANESYEASEEISLLNIWELSWGGQEASQFFRLLQTALGLSENPTSEESRRLERASERLLNPVRRLLSEYLIENEGTSFDFPQSQVENLINSSLSQAGFSEAGLAFEEWSFSEEKQEVRVTAQLRLPHLTQREGEGEPAAVSEVFVRRPQDLKTELWESPRFQVYESRVNFEWGQAQALRPGERIFYSYQLREPDEDSLTQKDWGAWSSWSEDQSLEMILTQPGRYSFRVKSMNLDYQIESEVSAESEFYFYGSFVKGEGAGFQEEVSEELWARVREEPTAESPSENSSAQNVTPTNSKGPFGCQARADHASSSLGWWVLWLLSFSFLAIRSKPR